MKVLVDTCIWSIAFRHRYSGRSQIVEKLTQLIEESRAILIGPVRQEILSGYQDTKKFQLLKKKLAAFEDPSILQSDYEKAAEFSNLCRAKGIQGSHTDFLICAVAHTHQMAIFTVDKDFTHYAKHLSIRLL